MDQELFFENGFKCSPEYDNIRDLSHFSEAKEFIEQLWREYRNYADPHFRDDAKAHFQERFWEMYSGVTLISHGFTLDAGGTTGPEFYIMNVGKKIWWEAIAPGSGDGADGVPGSVYGASDAEEVPAERISLDLGTRLRKSIENTSATLSRTC